MTLHAEEDPTDDRGLTRALCGAEWLNSAETLAPDLPVAWHKCYRPPGHAGQHRCICDATVAPEQLNA